MTSQEPDYSNMSMSDLLDVERHINREMVPERWHRLQAALSSRRTAGEVERIKPHLSRRTFVALHAIASPVLLAVLLVAFPGKGPEAAAGRDMALWTLLPASLLLSGGSFLVHPFYCRARHRSLLLVISVLVTPFASVAVVVLAYSLMFLLVAS
ncbi:MAG: hypothetical protein ACSLE8_00675 [Rhodococcus sp. (in: high G+C Gram-positive bacteria)]